MAFFSLKLPPGVWNQGTQYQGKGRWKAAQLVRFIGDTKRPVGGWSLLKTTGATLSGTVRALLGWRIAGAASPHLAIATNSKLFTFIGGALTDRTIGNLSAGAAKTSYSTGAYGMGKYGIGKYGVGDVAQSVSTVNAGTWSLDTFGNYLLACLTPTDGRLLVWKSGTDTLQPVSNMPGVGVLTVASGSIANGDTVTIGTKTYTWQTTLTNVNGNVLLGATNATALANLASAINLTTGAGSTYAAAMTKHTLVSAVAATTTLTVTQLIYGTATIPSSEVIVDAGITWGAGNLAGGLTGGAPTSCTGLVVTNERFLFALGVGRDTAGNWESNPRGVAWCCQESLGDTLLTATDWVPTTLNTAGDFQLPGTGRLVCGARGRNETLLWTDEDLFAAQYIGGTLIYAFTQLGQKCGIIAPMAKAVVDGRAAWMGPKGFWVYDGYVKPAPSEVSDYVFQHFNHSQRIKCWAEARTDFGEIWFHYPSDQAGNSGECDRYVIWNYWENHWTPGVLPRTAGIDRGAFDYPILASSAPALYEHELGNVTTAGWPADTPRVAPYLESGPVEMGEGDQVVQVVQLIPDEATLAGQQVGSLHAHLFAQFYPDGTETTSGPHTLANPTSVRLTGRQLRVRFDEASEGDWRLGVVRFDVKAGGKR